MIHLTAKGDPPNLPLPEQEEEQNRVLPRHILFTHKGITKSPKLRFGANQVHGNRHRRNASCDRSVRLLSPTTPGESDQRESDQGWSQGRHGIWGRCTSVEQTRIGRRKHHRSRSQQGHRRQHVAAQGVTAAALNRVIVAAGHVRRQGRHLLHTRHALVLMRACGLHRLRRDICTHMHGSSGQ